MTDVPPSVTVQELMQRDPLKLSEQDIEQIIAHFRKQRITFKTTGSIAKPKAAKPLSPKAQKRASIASQLDLEGFEL